MMHLALQEYGEGAIAGLPFIYFLRPEHTVRLHPSDGGNTQGRCFTVLPFLHVGFSLTCTLLSIPMFGENQVAINSRCFSG
ncbi:hypothetical protein KCP75_25620 [Salmonella enterica subsp. enterica]|nr:hypothetical protein KCP75_25620 [Salmonella enterica subsp. enterica]